MEIQEKADLKGDAHCVFQQNPPDKDSMRQSSEDLALVGLGHGFFCTGKDPFSESIDLRTPQQDTSISPLVSSKRPEIVASLQAAGSQL
ncbi:unnamed protein product [Sphagnum tenellum]